MSKRSKSKRYWEMNADELTEATAEFNQEFVADEFGTLTPEMQARWNAAKRGSRKKNSVPKNRRAAQVVSVRLEKGLLAQSDALAKRLNISRADLFARGLRAVLAAEGESVRKRTPPAT